MRNCKECGKALPKGNTVISWTARLMGYCRYCYRMNFPRRRKATSASYRLGTNRPLSWTEVRLAERAGFNPEVWSPEFRREMEDYWEARMRGEV